MKSPRFAWKTSGWSRPAATALASRNLQIVAWCVPGLMLHALFSVPLQASERFVLAGLGSLLFNLPPVAYLALAGTASQPHSLALACLAGSLLMPLALLPSVWRQGWRPWRWRRSEPAKVALLSIRGSARRY